MAFTVDPSSLLSILLIIFGGNELPPKFYHVTQAKCPAVLPQDPFNIRDLYYKTYYVNYGTTNNDQPKAFKCITVGIEKKSDGKYLKIVGYRFEDGKKEKAWHKLKQDGKSGRYEIDLRANHDEHEARAYLYYNPNAPENKLYIYVCIRFPKSKKHAEGVIIATDHPNVSPQPIQNHLAELKRLTNNHTNWHSKGLIIRNDCPTRETHPEKKDGNQDSSSDHPNSHKHPKHPKHPHADSDSKPHPHGHPHKEHGHPHKEHGPHGPHGHPHNQEHPHAHQHGANSNVQGHRPKDQDSDPDNLDSQDGAEEV